MNVCFARYLFILIFPFRELFPLVPDFQVLEGIIIEVCLRELPSSYALIISVGEI